MHDSIYQYNFSYNNEGGTLLVMNNTNNNIFFATISARTTRMRTGCSIW
ncbi:hypothetical protein ACFTAO_14305 [Paenibacillus rhizoplanae]